MWQLLASTVKKTKKTCLLNPNKSVQNAQVMMWS